MESELLGKKEKKRSSSVLKNERKIEKGKQRKIEEESLKGRKKRKEEKCKNRRERKI